jgi:hypothetical protein
MEHKTPESPLVADRVTIGWIGNIIYIKLFSCLSSKVTSSHPDYTPNDKYIDYHVGYKKPLYLRELINFC